MDINRFEISRSGEQFSSGAEGAGDDDDDDNEDTDPTWVVLERSPSVHSKASVEKEQIGWTPTPVQPIENGGNLARQVVVHDYEEDFEVCEQVGSGTHTMETEEQDDDEEEEEEEEEDM